MAAHDDIASRIEYSEKYMDHEYEYRHVILPKELSKTITDRSAVLTEDQWRSIGVQQSRGWEHYSYHRPEPHILLFRRPLGTDPTTGKVDERMRRAAVEKYRREYGVEE